MIDRFGLLFSIVAPLIFVFYSGYFLTLSLLYVFFTLPDHRVRIFVSGAVFLFHFSIFCYMSGWSFLSYMELGILFFGLICAVAAEITTRWLWSFMPRRDNETQQS